MSRHLAAKWLQEAEKLAGLEKLDGSLWHSYRRKWATERKHLPDTDVAAAGGWKNPNTLRLIYQQPDQETMLRVVLERGKLREANQKGDLRYCGYDACARQTCTYQNGLPSTNPGKPLNYRKKYHRAVSSVGSERLVYTRGRQGPYFTKYEEE